MLLLLSSFAAASESTSKGETRRSGAREVAAILDMQALRDAEEIAYLDTGYLHPLEDLNDLMGSVPVYYFDDIMDGGGARVIDLATGRFRSQRLDVRQAGRRWTGPYVTFQNGHIAIDGAGYDPGTPIDPWGSPYYLYTPVGLVRPTLGSVTLEDYADTFHRYAIVCLAADVVMSEDDLIVYFGGGVYGTPTATVISSVRPSVASPGQTVRIRGYNFGTQGANTRIEINSARVLSSTIELWSDREIAFTAPSSSSTGNLTIVTESGRVSNAMRFEVRVSARRWWMYG